MPSLARWKIAGQLLLLVGLLLPFEAPAIDMAGPTSEWVGIPYLNTPDPYDDQQTGQPEADIVGNDLGFDAVWTQYDAGALPDTSDDVLGFRLRMGAQTNPDGFSHVALVGIDANGDYAMDLYLVVSNSGNATDVQLYDPGNKANISPSTTSTVVTSYSYSSGDADYYYDWSIVTTTNCTECTASDLDIDGDLATDYFLSWAIPFDDIVNALATGPRLITGITPDSAFTYVIGTSTQPNAFNQDIGGIDDATLDPNATWETLGVISDPITPTGNPVPEPGTALLLGLGLIGLATRRR